MRRVSAGLPVGLTAVLAALLLLLLAGALPATATPSANMVVSQVYGGGGNTNATYQNDFVELFNRGTATVSLSGWSVQYTSATGTGNFGSATNLITPLSGSLAPGQYLLVQEASTAAVGATLPTPDVTDSTPINMAQGAGKVALVNTTTPLGCNGGSNPCGSAALATIVDLVGYGTGTSGANFFEGSGPAPTISSTLSDFRGAGGCTDTDDNAADFTSALPAPRNTASPLHDCTVTSPTGVGAANPSSVGQGGATLLTVAVTPGTNPASTGIGVVCNLTSIGGSATQAFFDDGSNGDAAAGDNTFSFAATVSATAGGKSLPCTVSDAQARSTSASIALTVEAPLVAIHDIQGAAHISPLAGQLVSTTGIVTAKAGNGFWIQDPSPDADPATSEGVFVFTSSAPTVSVGDSVKVTARVQEFRPGGASTANLTTTELASPGVSVLSTGNPLPPTTIVGNGGRIPPDTVIEDDATGNVETSGVFDPQTDGLDFWESLEGMRVQLNNAVAVGPTNSFGETQIVGDGGANASVRTARGGLLLRPNDANPERVVADDALVPMPSLNVGDGYTGPIVGVLDYNFGNYFVEVTDPVGRVDNGLQREVTSPAATNEIEIATFNFENLAPVNPQSKFDRLASLVVNNLQSPDIIAGEEVQDDNGAPPEGGADDGTVTANQTLTRLVAAIQAAGGPTYEWREIDPVNDQDGGEPGGNIRQVFLFRTDRGLSFVPHGSCGSTDATAVSGSGASTQLTCSPGRIDPASDAWASSRKPLAGEFLFRGHHLFVIANHFNSKGGDDPLEGRFQPPFAVTEAQRHQQAHEVADFVSQIESADSNANVVVLGDLNDFEFSDTVSILESAGLNDLMKTLPLDQRYSYEFEGNAQVLDHILLSGTLTAKPFVFDPVHVNAEFFDQASDHDPSVVRIALDEKPTADAGGPYTVDEGSSITLGASGGDAEGSVSYAWDLDDNGSFETPGQNVTFSAGDGPASPTVRVQVTDSAGQTATASATVTVKNVAPTATFNAPSSAPAGFPFTLSLTSPHDPSSADTTAGFAYAFDCGDGSGYGAFGSSSSVSCPTSTTGTRTVKGKIRDKDGDFTEYTATVNVHVTFDSLCSLTRTLITKADVAQSLCDKLVAAATADAAGDVKTRNNNLAAYRKLVDAQTGKAITAANADYLKQLSLQLQT